MAASSSQMQLAFLDSHCREVTDLLPKKILGICCSALISPHYICSQSDSWFASYLLLCFSKT